MADKNKLSRRALLQSATGLPLTSIGSRGVADSSTGQDSAANLFTRKH